MVILKDPTDSKQYLKIKLDGYRSYCLKIPRERNWILPVRPLSTDTQAWYDGWDLANKELNTKTKE